MTDNSVVRDAARARLELEEAEAMVKIRIETALLRVERLRQWSALLVRQAETAVAANEMVIKEEKGYRKAGCPSKDLVLFPIEAPKAWPWEGMAPVPENTPRTTTDDCSSSECSTARREREKWEFGHPAC